MSQIRRKRGAAVALARRAGSGYGFRGEVFARVRGPECLCTEPILTGDPIVKRWNRWIHAACYAEIRAAQDAQLVPKDERL